VRFGAPIPLFAVLENWLDRERDQLPLWLPVGIGFGVAFWQFCLGRIGNVMRFLIVFWVFGAPI